MSKAKKGDVSRLKLLTAAGQAFRERGISGVGVDGLAERADRTSGAFYFYFGSKLEAFIESVRVGLEDLRLGVEEMRRMQGKNWLRPFVAFYFSDRRTCKLGVSCALPSLTPDVERAGEKAREVYEDKLLEVHASVAAGLTGDATLSREEQAWALLALLSGGVAMARAVHNAPVSEQIAAALERAAAFLFEPQPSAQ